MGKLAQRYAKFMQIKLPAEKPKAEENPAGFVAFQRLERKKKRAEQYATNVIETADISLEETMTALTAVVGEEKAEQMKDTASSGNYMINTMNTYLKQHPESYANLNLTDEQQKALQKGGYSMLGLVEDLCKEGKFDKKIYEDLLALCIRVSIKSLTEKEQISFLDKLEEKMSPERVEQVCEKLDAFVEPTDLKPDQIWQYPYAQLIQQLKDNVPENIKKDQEKQAKYHQALEWANEHLKVADDGLRDEYKKRETEDHQPVEARFQKKIQEKEVWRYKDGIYGRDIVQSGEKEANIYYIPRENEKAFQEMMHDKVRFSDKTKEGLRKMIRKMDELGLLDQGAAGEDGSKAYSFGKLLKCKNELTAALQKGDPDEIMEKTESYRRITEGMQELYSIAREYFKADENVFPGNMDSVRNSAVPFEMASDLKTTAQINTVFLVYSELGKGANGLEEYLESPTVSVVENAFAALKPYTYEELSKEVKTYDDAIDLLTESGKYKTTKAEMQTAFQIYGLARAIAGPTLLESDDTVLTGNLIYSNKAYSLVNSTLLGQSFKIGYLNNNDRLPSTLFAKIKTLTNLLILPDEERDMLRIFGDAPSTDMYGHITGKCIEPEVYMTDHEIDYDLVIERANKYIQKSIENMKAGDAIEQIAQSYIWILKARQADLGTEGYEKLVKHLSELEKQLPQRGISEDKREHVIKTISNLHQEFKGWYDKRMENVLQYGPRTEREKQEGIASLREKAYGVANPDPMSINWGPDPVTAKELKAAARQIFAADMDKDTISHHGLGYVMDQVNRVEKLVTKVAGNPVFRSYVTKLILDGKQDIFADKEAFTAGWTEYKKEAELKQGALEEEISDSPFLDDIDLQEEEDPDFVIEEGFDKAAYKRNKTALVAEIRQKMQARLQGMERIEGTDYLLGADIVIAGLLADSAMQRNFLDSDAGFYKKNAFDRDKMNNSLDEIRKQIIADKAFLKVLADHPNPETLYSDYKKAVRREVNRRIDKKKERDKYEKTNRRAKAEAEMQKDKITLELSDDVKKSLKETYETLLRINKDHKESDQMKNLMKALKAVQNKDSVSFKELDKVNNCALIYHNDRQGIIFSPFTDKGKLRLDTVEKMIRKTDKALAPSREKIKKNVDKALAYMR